MTARQRFPDGGPFRPDDPPGGDPLIVGDDRIRAFLVGTGRRLLDAAVRHRLPELGPLGMFLRAASLDRLLADLTAPASALRFPRGRVFHVPPGNVDTLFLYVWGLAALAGNHNVVRLPSRSSAVTEVVLDALNDGLATADPVVGATQRMIAYGRDDALTARLSAACDLRVLWGGDESVERLRRFPLAPAARDLTFPDRSSFAVLSVAAWHAAGPAARRGLAERLCDDVYWFDQAACASPRTLFWVGPAERAGPARDELNAELAAVVAGRRPPVTPSAAVGKFVSAYVLAGRGDATRIAFPDNAITHLDLAGPDRVAREPLGPGSFAWARVDRLTDVAALVRRRDQTVTHFGFARAELEALARACGGRGVDRIVPVGAALSFGPVWDGHDLMREFTRLTTVS